MKRLLMLSVWTTALIMIGCVQDWRAELFARNPAVRDSVRRATGGGEPDRGRAAIRRYGCEACHTIPGIPGGRATVGPPLSQFAGRSYIAGHLPNSPGNLMQWIQSPHSVVPHTLMPEMGVKENDARDISAYLYTLR